MTAAAKKELMRREQAIARRFMGGVPWFAVFWAFANLATWLALWPLVILGYLPLWAAFPIATLNVMLSYLPSHEAQHDIIARPGTRWRWLNQAVGWLSTIPLVLPYRVARLTHLEHHRHTNDPARDPDYGTRAKGPVDAILKSIVNRQPRAEGGLNGYGETLMRLGRPDVVLEGVLYQMVFYGLLCGLAWAGFGLEALLLWWLPRHIGLTYIQFFLSWAPHHPGEEQGRYRNTRAWRSALGNIGSMGMQFHIVHHLHPTIPLTRTPAAYRALRPVLEARGCELDRI
ncbi:beta-carotene hydroxylase [Parasphingopyxis algicola]|nr:beta-carotene hydroxylase [Parasphingopyxis algicola]